MSPSPSVHVSSRHRFLLARSGVCAALLCAAAAFGAPLTGIILPVQDVDLTFAVPGIVAEANVREGQKVTAGQVLLRQEDELEALDVKKAEALVEQARFEHEAASKLIAESIGTRSDALAKRIALDLALNVLDIARARQRQRALRSPIDGVVVRIHKEPGEAAMFNEVAVRVVRLDRVNAQFYMTPGETANLRAGEDFQMRLAPPAATGGSSERQSASTPTFTGKVVLVDPVLDAESALVRVRVEVDNAKGELKAGMRVESGGATRTP